MALKKIKIPKMNFKKLDWSKWNFRKMNWQTILAVIAYLPVLTIISLVFSSKNPYLTFHVRQGIALHLLWILFVFSFFLPLIPWILAVALLALTVIGIINVVSGHERKLPVVGQLI
ncbi:MAG: hypothetical protein WC227_01560 [Patescibacteria group bacterium]|jgi:uncharacterized membrane protein